MVVVITLSPRLTSSAAIRNIESRGSPTSSAADLPAPRRAFLRTGAEQVPAEQVPGE